MADDLQVSLHLGVGAGSAQDKGKLASGAIAGCVRVAEDHHRVHGMADPLARLQTVHVVLFQVPVGHAVIQEDASVSGDEAGPPGALDALELADGVALAIHDHEAGGVLLFLAGADFRGTACGLGRLVGPGVAGPGVISRALGVNEPGAVAGVVLGKQALDGDVNIVGVGDEGLAVNEGKLLGLHHQVDTFGGVAAEGFEVEPLDQVQFLEEDMAAGVGRGLVNGVAVVGGGNGVLPAGPAVSQVLQRQDTALFLAELDDGPGNFTLVKGLASAVDDSLEGAGQVSLEANLAGLQGPSTRGEDSLGSGELAEERVGGDGPGQDVGDGEAVAAKSMAGAKHSDRDKTPCFSWTSSQLLTSPGTDTDMMPFMGMPSGR